MKGYKCVTGKLISDFHMKRILTIFISSIFISGLFLGIVPKTTAALYTYTSIDFLGATFTTSYGINNLGSIVGQYRDPVYHGYLYDGASYSSIDPPGATSSYLRDINDAGTLVGQYKDTKSHAYLFDGTIYTTLDFPASLWTKGAGINNTGYSVGAYGDVTGEHGYLYDGVVYTTLDVPESVWTWAEGINDSLSIVGAYENGPNDMHGFLYDGISFITIDFPGALKTHAYDINNAGFIVGSYYDGLDTHGFLFDGHSYITIDYPGVSYTRAVGLNDFGQIVGNYIDLDGIGHGFIASSATLIKLASFGADCRSNEIIIEWNTLSELDNAGFNVWRRSGNGPYIKINSALIEAEGGATLSAAYSFTDDTALPGGTYYYKLEDIDTSGGSTFHGPVSATMPAINLIPLWPLRYNSYLSRYWWSYNYNILGIATNRTTIYCGNFRESSMMGFFAHPPKS